MVGMSGVELPDWYVVDLKFVSYNMAEMRVCILHVYF